eukprot:6783191-Prymnesium_polylepis.1
MAASVSARPSPKAPPSKRSSSGTTKPTVAPKKSRESHACGRRGARTERWRRGGLARVLAARDAAVRRATSCRVAERRCGAARCGTRLCVLSRGRQTKPKLLPAARSHEPRRALWPSTTNLQRRDGGVALLRGGARAEDGADGEDAEQLRRVETLGEPRREHAAAEQQQQHPLARVRVGRRLQPRRQHAAQRAVQLGGAAVYEDEEH